MTAIAVNTCAHLERENVTIPAKNEKITQTPNSERPHETPLGFLIQNEKTKSAIKKKKHRITITCQGGIFIFIN